MVLDLSKFERRHDFDLETQSHGIVRCGTLKVSTLSGTANALANPNGDALLQCRNILQIVGRKIVLSADNQESSEAALSDEDIQEITDEEIEAFSKDFVSHNDWLLHSYDNANKQESSSHENDSIGPSRTEPDALAKGDGERNSDYLIRVLHRYFEAQGERLKKMLEPLSKGLASDTFAAQIKKLTEPLSVRLASSAFDASTLESLRRNISISDQLKDTLRAFEKSAVAREITAEPARLEIHPLRPIDFPENPIVETNRRLGSMLDQIGEMRALAARSAELIDSMNQTTLKMQANFISNARSTQRSALVAIGIAVLSLLASSFFSWLSYSDGKEQAEKSNTQIKLYQAEVAKLIEAQEKDRAVLVDALKKSHQPAAPLINKLPGTK